MPREVWTRIELLVFSNVRVEKKMQITICNARWGMECEESFIRRPRSDGATLVFANIHKVLGAAA